MTTAYVFRSLGFPLKNRICLSQHTLSLQKQSCLQLFIYQTNVFSSNTFKEKRLASNLFFQKAFVWQVSLLRSWQEASSSPGGNAQSEGGLEVVAVSTDFVLSTSILFCVLVSFYRSAEKGSSWQMHQWGFRDIFISWIHKIR